MAADDAAVTVTLRANLKDYEAALKAAVRATERAAQSAEKAVANVGKTARPDFRPLNDNFQKSAGQLANDARVLQFQLNDIFSGLASGQGIRALQVQLGQIAQQLGGGGLAQGARTLGTALVGMINPINLAVVAFGFAATAAANYFFGAEEGAEKTNKSIKEQADLLRRVADAYGDVLPGVRALADEMDRIAKANDAASATAVLVAKAYEPAVKRVDDLALAAADVAIKLGDALSIEQASQFTSKWDALVEKLEDHSATAADVKAVQDTLMATGIQGAIDLARNLDGVRIMIDSISGSARKAEADLRNMLGWSDKFQGPPMPGFLQLPGTVGAVPERRPMIEFEADPAAERAAREAADKINRSIIDSIGAAADAAEQLLGQHEIRNAGSINAFLKKGGVNLNAATTAWCAAFVNSALAQVGITGSGSNVATDFAKWGVKVQPQDVVRGDVLVETRGRAPGQTGGHVGFATGQMRTTADGIRQIEMLSGNAANKVTKDWVNVSEVIARRATESAGYTAAQLRHLTESQKVSVESTIEALNRETQTLQQQGAVYGATSATVNQALIAKQAHAEVIRIENDLLAQNIELTTVQRDALLQSVTANLTAAASLKAAQKEGAAVGQTLQNVMMTVGQMAAQGLVGFVQDLRNGVDAAEALYNMVSRIADQLLSMALNMMIQSLFKGIAGGIGGMPMFATGGYTGDVGTRRPAGVVHGQEFVVNARATRKHRELLESINRGLPGYASGGFVLPNPRRMAQQAAALSQSVSQPPVARTSVINMFDASSFLSEALSKPEGANVVLNLIRSQPGAFRTAMQG